MAGTDLVFHRRTWASDEDPRDASGQFTTTTARTTGTFEPKRREQQEQGGTNRTFGVVACPYSDVGYIPGQGDLVEADGVFYVVTESNVIGGVILRLVVEGPAPDPAEGADTAAPTIAPSTLTTTDDQIGFGGTISESAQWRVRHRRPADTGEYTTGAYQTATTSISGTLTGLDTGTYRVQLQAKDSSDNEGRWTDCGTIFVVGDGAT